MMQNSFVKTAKWLAYFTVIYNLLEGIISIYFGLNNESFALAGFGVDSLIEVGSALLVIWRLKSDFDHGSPMSLQAEKKATLGIGILFVLLALLTGVAAATQLLQHHHPDSTIPGVIVSLISLSFMFYLWKAKLRVARELDSKTLEADASCSLACIKLSFILFIGSLLYWQFPLLWWADSAATIGLSVLIFREGWESIQNSRKENFTGGCGCH